MRIDTAFVLVPKTSSDFNDLSQNRENKVRLSREVRTVKAESVAHRVNYAPHNHLRLCSLASNATHVFAAPDSRDGIDHCRKEMIR
jgi:hypothetical protein